MTQALTKEGIELFQRFVSETGRAESTTKAYGTDLRSLLNWSGRKKLIHSNLEAHSIRWLASGQNVADPTKTVASATTLRRIATLREYANWANLGDDFLKHYRPPKKDPKDPHPLPAGMDDIDRLLRAADTVPMVALVTLCGLMGLRVNEAVTTPARALNIHNKRLVVEGKGSKKRILPVSEKAWPILLTSAIGAGLQTENQLVPMSQPSARAKITRLGVVAEIARPIKGHDLRATFATDMYARTKDLLTVQKWLGHSSPETTQGYILTDFDTMRAAAV